MRKKRFMIFILFAFGIIVVGTHTLNQNNAIKKFLQDPFRSYKNSQYGRVEHGAVKITNDGKFRIENNIDEQLCFNMYYEIGLEYEILKDVLTYKTRGNKCFIKSSEGYAVIEIKTEACKVFVTVPKDNFVKYSGSVDENGNKIFKSRIIEDKNVKYLSSFNEFSSDEKDFFENDFK